MLLWEAGGCFSELDSKLEPFASPLSAGERFSLGRRVNCWSVFTDEVHLYLIKTMQCYLKRLWYL